MPDPDLVTGLTRLRDGLRIHAHHATGVGLQTEQPAGELDLARVVADDLARAQAIDREITRLSETVQMMGDQGKPFRE